MMVCVILLWYRSFHDFRSKESAFLTIVVRLAAVNVGLLWLAIIVEHCVGNFHVFQRQAVNVLSTVETARL